MSKDPDQDPDDWEQQLKAAGLSARRDADWRNCPRVSLEAMKFHVGVLLMAAGLVVAQGGKSVDLFIKRAKRSPST